jgi:hypothetical protein
MISLKRDPKKEDGEGGETSCSPCWERDLYPLSIWVMDEEFKKLGLKGKALSDEFEMTIKVRVTALDSHETVDDGKAESRSSATLTILAADVPGAETKAPAADRIFGSSS